MITKSTFIFLIAFSVSHFANANATEVSLGFNKYYFDYEEVSETSQSLNNETGSLTGNEFQIVLPIHDRFKAQLNYEYIRGTVNYDGRTQIGIPHETATVQKMRHAGAKLMLPVQNTAFANTFWQGLIGLNRRQWYRYIQPNNGVLGLDEKYQWDEFEVGALIIHELDSYSSLELGASLLFAFDQFIRVDLRPSGFGIVNIELGKIFGQSLSAKYQWRINKSLNLYAGLNYNHWHFERSETVTASSGINIIGVTEPESNTHRYQLNTGLIWQF